MATPHSQGASSEARDIPAKFLDCILCGVCTAVFTEAGRVVRYGNAWECSHEQRTAIKVRICGHPSVDESGRCTACGKSEKKEGYIFLRNA